jgi:hypothetical protein
MHVSLPRMMNICYFSLSTLPLFCWKDEIRCIRTTDDRERWWGRMSKSEHKSIKVWLNVFEREEDSLHGRSQDQDKWISLAYLIPFFCTRDTRAIKDLIRRSSRVWSSNFSRCYLFLSSSQCLLSCQHQETTTRKWRRKRVSRWFRSDWSWKQGHRWYIVEHLLWKGNVHKGSRAKELASPESMSLFPVLCNSKQQTDDDKSKIRWAMKETAVIDTDGKDWSMLEGSTQKEHMFLSLNVRKDEKAVGESTAKSEEKTHGTRKVRAGVMKSLFSLTISGSCVILFCLVSGKRKSNKRRYISISFKFGTNNIRSLCLIFAKEKHEHRSCLPGYSQGHMQFVQHDFLPFMTLHLDLLWKWMSYCLLREKV